MVTKFITSRLERLDRLSTCPILYIGSAGTLRNSKNTLRGRYREFANRHTAMYPLWLLLYNGWELEYGYYECNDPEREEKKVKHNYRRLHAGALPALVKN